MDFGRSTVVSEECDLAHTSANLARRHDEVRAARALRDRTLGEHYPTVRDFYRGQHVFVTGASGFIGKVVVEKLLRTCPDVGSIYVLIRPRKGQEPAARLKAILDVPLFDRLRRENPSALDKVVVVKGDLYEDGLGISPADRRTLAERVSIVIHSAATVRFTDPIKTAAKLNLRSTVDIVDLARTMKNLKALVHVSTAYCFTNHNPTQECVYPTDHDWRDVLKYAKLPDSDALDLLGNKFMGFQPNSYVFTKALAERAMNEAALDLPVIIVRPSIVTCATAGPLPGWMDNLNGFAMIWAVYSKGVLRYSLGESTMKYDLMPVDVVGNLTILASWARGTNQPLPIPSGNTPVVNITGGDVKPTTIFMMKSVMRRHAEEGTVGYPGAIRYPRAAVVKNKVAYHILTFFYHIVFGTVVDAALAAVGRKPMLMPLYRKMAFAFESLSYFQHNEFHFCSDNLWRLVGMVHPKDRDEYDVNYENERGDWLAISKDQLLGVAKFALKEKLDTEEDVRKECRRLNRLWWAELGWYVMLAVFAAWVLYKRFL